MPELPSANNSSNLKAKYKSRLLYDYYYEEDVDQFDFWYKTPFYGKVDTNGETVYPIESFLTTVSKDTDEQQVLCLNFVAEAFRKLRLHYETLYLDGYLNNNSTFFNETLAPIKGWASSTKSYTDNQQFNYEELFEQQLVGLSESPVIKNFDDFVRTLKDFVIDNKKSFTRIGYQESNNVSAFNTGLTLQIFEGEYGDDKLAFDLINDPNFFIFQELCRKYGFRIDRNNPLRITANIVSDNMTPFISETGVATLTANGKDIVDLDSFFNNFYEKLNNNEYFMEFEQYLKIYYITFIQAFPRYKDEGFTTDGCRAAFYRLKDREPAPNLTKEKTLEFFYDFRIAEAGLNVSTKKRQFHLKNAVTIYRSLKDKGEQKALSKALDYIQYNIGTITFRDIPLQQNNLTRVSEGVTISPQDQFERKTGEDSSYLNDFSDS